MNLQELRKKERHLIKTNPCHYFTGWPGLVKVTNEDTIEDIEFTLKMENLDQ